MQSNIRNYTKQLRKLGIAYKSVTLSYDTTTNTKKCIHPPGWQNTTISTSTFEPNKNALIQITGINSNIIVIDTDGRNHPTNKMINDLCHKHCKYINETRKGYHFFFRFTEEFAKCQSIKYLNDPEHSGLDIKSTNGCVYYGSYKIGDELVKYENLICEDIVPMPTELIKELKALFTKSDKPTTNQRKTTKYPSLITNTTNNFPECTIIDIATLDKLIACFPSTYFENYPKWIEICFLIKQSNHTDQAFQLFYKYSKSITKYANVSESECRAKWDSIKYEPGFIFQEMLFIARKHNKKLFNTIKLPYLDSYSNLYTPTTFNDRYINYNFIYPHYEQNKSIAILSPYGTGKTQFLSTLFNQITTTQNPSILFITPRVSLSYTLLKSFPQFNHYQQISNPLLKASNKLIIQLDSIYKLEQKYDEDLFQQNRDYINIYLPAPPVSLDINNIPKHIITYDIIALDEIESLLYHLSFDKLNSQHIFNILVKLCINAKKIIAMDGDYSDRAHFFLSKISEMSSTPKPIVLQNEYKTDPKHFIFTNDQPRFYKDLDDALKLKKKIVLICLTLETSEHFKQLYQSTYKVIIHNSIQNDKTGLTNINDYWKCDLLIYTSTIESGCDFTQEWFDKCFIVLSDKGTTQRALMQMCNRIRNFKDTNILVYNNNVPFYEFQIPYTFDDVKRTAFKNMLDDHGQLNMLDTILCYNEVETLNKEYFITILTRLLTTKGHTYEYQRINKPQHTKMKSDIYRDIANATPITNEAEYCGFLKDLRKPDITAENMRDAYYMIKKYIVSKVWGIDINTIDVDDIRMYLPKIDKLHNYKYFITFLGNRNKTSYKNVKLEKQINYIKDILRHFGIHHQDQFAFSIDCGISKEGRERNKKENPNILNSQQYQNAKTVILPIIKDKDFRFAFGLDKITKDITDRQFLETIKKVISNFGFTLSLSTNIFRNGASTTYENSYFIDLDNTILEYIRHIR